MVNDAKEANRVDNHDNNSQAPCGMMRMQNNSGIAGQTENKFKTDLTEMQAELDNSKSKECALNASEEKARGIIAKNKAEYEA